MNLLKNTTLVAAGGGVLAVVATNLLKESQLVTAGHWAEVVGVIGAALVAASAGFLTKLRK